MNPDSDRVGGPAMNKPKLPDAAAPVWRQSDGAPVSCIEKLKVLNENYQELRQMAQDALEDALIMGCSEQQVREALHQLVDELLNPYPPEGGGR
jgi:hypothetical protein